MSMLRSVQQNMPNVSRKLYQVSNLSSIQEYNYKISASQSKIISPGQGSNGNGFRGSRKYVLGPN